jgi:DNA-directed RNA polymerase subunit RPC12/RpoP
MKQSPSLLNYVADVIFLPLYFYFFLRKREASREQNCLVCDAPYEMSAGIQHIRREELKRCLYCSTRVGWKYRPFEVNVIKRLYLMGIGLVASVGIGLAVFFAYSQGQCIAERDGREFANRFAQSSCACEAVTNLSIGLRSAQEVSNTVLVPNPNHLYYAAKLNNYFSIQNINVDSVQFTLRPMRLSPQGNWLLLEYENQFALYFLSKKPGTVGKLDLTPCKLDSKVKGIDLHWSPDEKRVVLVVESGKKQQAKIATLDARDESIPRLTNCVDAYSENVESAIWLDNDHLLAFYGDEAVKRLEVRVADAPREAPRFSATFPLDGITSDLHLSPDGRAAIFAVRVSATATSKSLYWVDLSACGGISDLGATASVNSPLAWASPDQVAYLDALGKLSIFDVRAGKRMTSAVPPEIGGDKLAWFGFAWRDNANR